MPRGRARLVFDMGGQVSPGCDQANEASVLFSFGASSDFFFLSSSELRLCVVFLFEHEPAADYTCSIEGVLDTSSLTQDTCGTCSDAQYLSQEVCEAASNTWTAATWAAPAEPVTYRRATGAPVTVTGTPDQI
jgi:hypothetical protein